MDLSLYEMLKAHQKTNPCAMHMPGHKQRGEGDPLWEKIFSLDMTEVGEFDDLHAPEGILKRSMELAARVWGAEESFYLVGSATAGILAGVAGALQTHGKTVLLARNCHKSVYHACEMMQAKLRFVAPLWEHEAGMFSSLSPEAVKRALAEEPSVALVVITSPTYEGVISDVREIARVCHERNVPLMVDEAHGAHLGLWGVFPQGAVSAGADLVVQSLHKTLPSLTQTGILHCRWDRVDRAQLKRRLQMLQSSSPSYLLMASMDRCVRWLSQGQKEGFASWRDRVLALRAKINSLSCFTVALPKERIFAWEPTKLALREKYGRLTGKEIADALQKRGIFCEMSFGPNALLYTGAGTDEEDCRRVLNALREMEGEISSVGRGASSLFSPPAVQRAMELSDALAAEKEEGELSLTKGRISADYLWAYPPGIPLLCPGEKVTEEMAAYLLHLLGEDCRLLTASDSPRGRLKVVKNREK